MSRISSLCAKSTIREYAQGAAQEGVSKVADFLAPTVEVAKATGFFKIYTEKSRFRIPDTRRSIGGAAATLGWDRSDGLYNVEPHALDVPVDVAETDDEDTMTNSLQEAADLGSEVGSLSHEKEVVDLAVTATTGGVQNIDFAAALDPIDQIDAHIITLIKSANYGGMMGVRLLLGLTWARRLKNHPLIRARFPGAAKVSPGIDEIMSLLLTAPQVQISTLVYDDAPEGKAKDIKLILDTKALLFVARDNPTRRDPSFMKTFRQRGRWMAPRSYTSADGRQEFAGLDWSGKPYVTNTTGAIQLGISN
jgi:hypothetical protein